VTKNTKTLFCALCGCQRISQLVKFYVAPPDEHTQTTFGFSWGSRKSDGMLSQVPNCPLVLVSVRNSVRSSICPYVRLSVRPTIRSISVAFAVGPASWSVVYCPCPAPSIHLCYVTGYNALGERVKNYGWGPGIRVALPAKQPIQFVGLKLIWLNSCTF